MYNSLKIGKLTFAKTFKSTNLLSDNWSFYKDGALMKVIASILHRREYDKFKLFKPEKFICKTFLNNLIL